MHLRFSIKSIKNKSLLLLITGLLATTARGSDYENCVAFANNIYEETYCLVKAKGKGKHLPNFQDFKKSTPSTQWLLLKKHARVLNLDLPPVKPTPTKPSRKTRQAAPTLQKASKPSPSKTTVENNLVQCRLEKLTIQCGGNIYSLAQNSRRSLALMEKQVKYFDSELISNSPDEFMQLTYPIYINNMLAIGLGDSSMSFTKFNTIFSEYRKNQSRFAERFNNMFRLLIKEKQSIGSQARYSHSLPKSIEQCWRLNHDILICDNVSQNWIYTRQ